MPRKHTRKASRKSGRKTRKMNKKASAWNQLVMKHYHAGKAKDKNFSLSDAMKKAKQERDKK